MNHRYRLVIALLMAGAVLGGTALAQDGDTAANEPMSYQERVNARFEILVNNYLAPSLFWEVGASYDGPHPLYQALCRLIPGDQGPETVIVETSRPGIPFIICVLVVGGVFFTLRYGFINLRLFRHSIRVILGKYDHPDHEGEISHFKALTTALSATVGLGNIAGVAIAIDMGGPGAVFWMWVTAVFGMSMKFSSCTLAQVHRRIKPDGRVLGGPMVYLDQGIRTLFPNLLFLAKSLAILFALFTIMASFGGGNLFQANQTYVLFVDRFIADADNAPGWLPWLMGVVLAFPVGLVIIGGIKRIGVLTARMVPAMCLGYCLICLFIIFFNAGQIPSMFASIFREAFNPSAALTGTFWGAFVVVLVNGMKRAAFSNEAGLGSAAIAHAAAKTDEPVREGVVAMIGPFIDTICVCTMTALAILITGAHEVEGLEGIQITAKALEQLGVLMPYFLFAAVYVFAFSTVISWGYYGERCTEYLVGENGIMPYRVVYVTVVILGPVLSLGAVVDFADMALLSMAFPNILGMLFLSGEVKRLVDDYVRRLRSGEMKTYAQMLAEESAGGREG
jgi:alanine or glycine:cation symporter, AGCS family